MPSFGVRPQRAPARESTLFGAAGTAVRQDIRLIDVYDRYFEVVYPETAEQREAAFRLRYEVYCVEHAFEDPAANPNRMETDAFDPSALHAILVYRPDNSVVGTVRLIVPSEDLPPADLPIRRVCSDAVIKNDNPKLPWPQSAEISRFAISKRFRRRSEDIAPIGIIAPPQADARRSIPNTSLGLMQAIVAMAARSRMSHVCAMMEPALLRMLRRLGIHFIPAGPEVDYHGRRQPCHSDLDLLLTRIWVERPDVWEVITLRGELWRLNTPLAERLQSGPIDLS